MKVFVAFFKKELLETKRSGKLILYLILSVAFGIMNPAVAKLTPVIVELFADSLAEGGMIVTDVTVNAISSWTQFFKNIPMLLIIFVVAEGSRLSRELESGTLVLALSKGVERYKVVSAKASVTLLLWSAMYSISYLVTYFYTAFYWDNSIADSIGFSAFCFWLFGAFTLSLAVLFGTAAKSYTAVLLSACASVAAVYVISLIPTIGRFSPAKLMSGMELIVGRSEPIDFLPAALISALIGIAAVCLSFPIMNKREL